ncbi:hypothetical protein Misp04_11800 [Micromonospora sp. NBRC 101691]|nr:hypothetical protein Misp04_11800 [Micromonospora sp. NBRC 101691]
MLRSAAPLQSPRTLTPRAAAEALLAAVQQAAGSVAAAEAGLAIAKAQQALGEACISQFGNGPW